MLIGYFDVQILTNSSNVEVSTKYLFYRQVVKNASDSLRYMDKVLYVLYSMTYITCFFPCHKGDAEMDPQDLFITITAVLSVLLILVLILVGCCYRLYQKVCLISCSKISKTQT